MNALKPYKFEILFGTLLLQVVSPFFALLFIVPQKNLQIVSFTLLVLSSLIMANKAIPRALILVFGIFGALGLWCVFLSFYEDEINVIRIYSTCFFYMVLVYILTRNFIEAKTITLQVVIGAMSGYLLIGFLGASTIEMMDYHYPGSFTIDSAETFDYYYFSFISLVTVGFGDIVPVSYAAKSLTILISMIGQFYMAIGIASFVGKFMNAKN